jgi:outer membrane protein TolC
MTATLTYQGILQEAERLQDEGLLTKLKFKQLEVALTQATAEMPQHQQGDLLEALYVMADPDWD